MAQNSNVPIVDVRKKQIWQRLFTLRVELQDSFMKTAFSIEMEGKLVGFGVWQRCFNETMSIFKGIQMNNHTMPNTDLVISQYQAGLSMMNSALNMAVKTSTILQTGSNGGGDAVVDFFNSFQHTIRESIKLTKKYGATNTKPKSEVVDDKVVIYTGKGGCCMPPKTVKMEIFDCGKLNLALFHPHLMVQPIGQSPQQALQPPVQQYGQQNLYPVAPNVGYSVPQQQQPTTAQYNMRTAVESTPSKSTKNEEELDF